MQQQGMYYLHKIIIEAKGIGPEKVVNSQPHEFSKLEINLTAHYEGNIYI